MTDIKQTIEQVESVLTNMNDTTNQVMKLLDIILKQDEEIHELKRQLAEANTEISNLGWELNQ
jgi:predicted RNase H-like nuclease (RuvC/YqgF family)